MVLFDLYSVVLLGFILTSNLCAIKNANETGKNPLGGVDFSLELGGKHKRWTALLRLVNRAVVNIVEGLIYQGE